MKNETTSLLAGISGEYFVAAELSRRGYIASITLRNSRGVDILASNQVMTKTVSIQVKTTRKKQKDWILNKKAEDIKSRNHFYVFVNLGDDSKRPEFHIVPSREVAKFISKFHKSWLGTRGKGGRKHKDNSMRKFQDLSSKYRDKWNRLGL